MRLIVRRVRPTHRHLKKLTAFEKQTGWRYCITATNTCHMWGIAVSAHAQFMDVLHRSHAGVKDRVRTNKATGLGNLPSQSWEVNRGWMLAAPRPGRVATAAAPARHLRPGRRRAGHHAFCPVRQSQPLKNRGSETFRLSKPNIRYAILPFTLKRPGFIRVPNTAIRATLLTPAPALPTV
ncbi:hypothetical protein GCM10018966_100210 [Streptomyces yanii]